jgi:hypothetical protein
MICVSEGLDSIWPCRVACYEQKSIKQMNPFGRMARILFSNEDRSLGGFSELLQIVEMCDNLG